MKTGPVDYFDRCWVESVFAICRRENKSKKGPQTGFSHSEVRRIYREYADRKAQFGEVPRDQDLTWKASYARRKAMEEAQ